MPADTPIYIVDDDPDLCHALMLVLRMSGRCGHAFATPTAFLREIADRPVGVIVSDVCMPEIDGLDLLARLRLLGRGDPVIFMTGHGDIPLAVRALKQGAADFIEKPFEAKALLDAIDAVRGDDHQDTDPLFRQLSPRERQVLDRLVEGDSNKQIALRLGLSPRTVEFHRANLMAKLRCRNLSQLVRLGLSARGASELYGTASEGMMI